MSDRTSATESSYHREATDGYFAPLATAKYMLLTMFRPDGIAVYTPVHGVVDGDRAYFRIRNESGTAQRLRQTGAVQVTACAVFGLVTFGPPLDAVTRLLPPSGEETSQVARKLARKYPLQQRLLTPLLPRTRRWQMVHYELLGGLHAEGSCPDQEAADDSKAS